MAKKQIYITDSDIKRLKKLKNWLTEKLKESKK